jgi:hypothetical protein
LDEAEKVILCQVCTKNRVTCKIIDGINWKMHDKWAISLGEAGYKLL